MEYLNGSGNSSCCDTSCCYKFDVQGCAAGVPYIQLTLVTASVSTIKWMNLNTGDLVDTKPAGFVTGSCSDVSANDKVCYAFGSDTYQRYSVNSVVTIFKNGTLLTSSTDIDAANTVIAGATYENIVSCEPAQVNPDNAVCYSKTVTTPPTPGTDVFTVQSGFPVKQALTGTGTLLETVFTQTYTGGNESDGQYTLRDGANNHSGSPGSWAIAFNFGIGSPVAPYKIYSQKLIGTAGDTYSAGYWAKDRAGNLANFQAKVFDGATQLATGTSGVMNSTYTNYRTGTFVMPAAGFVMIEIWTLAGGNANGNDPLLDDIGLWRTTAEIPGTTTTTTYRKITSDGGVDTYYDAAGAEVTGAALTALLAAIAAGEYAVVPCATCGCDPADFISTDAGNSLIVGTDGKIYNAATALINDDQVLTGDNTGSVAITLTPTTVPDPLNPDVDQVNYLIKADVLVDGTSITIDPVTHKLSAVIPQIRMETETFTATAGQTDFVLAHTPLGDVDFNRNGVTLADAAATEGATVIYVAANNNGQPLLAGDRVDIIYTYAA